MKTSMFVKSGIVKSGIAAVAFLTITTAANAQSAGDGHAAHTATSTQPTASQSGTANRKYQRKDGAVISANYDRSARENAHAARSPSSPQKAKTGDNPLYEDNGHSGTNPLYESRKANRTKTETSAGASPKPVREVKGAPLKGAATSGMAKADKSASTGGGLGPDVYQRKHIAGVKYENRTDSHSKPTAGASKSVPAPPHKPR